MCPKYTCRVGKKDTSTGTCYKPEVFLQGSWWAPHEKCEDVFGQPWPISAELDVEDPHVAGCSVPSVGSLAPDGQGNGAAVPPTRITDIPIEDPEIDDDNNEDKSWFRSAEGITTIAIGITSLVIGLVSIPWCCGCQLCCSKGGSP